MNVEIQSFPVSVMNEGKIIPPNLHLLGSLFGELQDWPLINTSIWPPDIPNLLTGLIPLCAFTDSVLFKGPSALLNETWPIYSTVASFTSLPLIFFAARLD